MNFYSKQIRNLLILCMPNGNLYKYNKGFWEHNLHLKVNRKYIHSSSELVTLELIIHKILLIYYSFEASVTKMYENEILSKQSSWNSLKAKNKIERTKDRMKDNEKWQSFSTLFYFSFFPLFYVPNWNRISFSANQNVFALNIATKQIFTVNNPSLIDYSH